MEPPKIPVRRDTLAPMPAEFPRISVVIPTYNEADNLPHVLQLIPSMVNEVIIVDGGSEDNTLDVAREVRPDVRVFAQNRSGFGNAIACGFDAASGDIIALLPADGAADPREIESFVVALLNGADFVKGTRFAKGGGTSDVRWGQRISGRWLTATVNILFGTKYSDLNYSYCAFWRWCIPELLPSTGSRYEDGATRWGDGFEYSVMLPIRIVRSGFTMAEIPSFEFERIHGRGNFRRVRDGWRLVRGVVEEARRPPVRSKFREWRPWFRPSVERPTTREFEASMNAIRTASTNRDEALATAMRFRLEDLRKFDDVWEAELRVCRRARLVWLSALVLIICALRLAF